MRSSNGSPDMMDKIRSDKAEQIAPVPRISIQAFCDSADVSQVVTAAAADRRMDRAQIKVHMGGAPAAVEAYRSAPTPNIIIIESNAARDELLAFLETLAESCDAGEDSDFVCGSDSEEGVGGAGGGGEEFLCGYIG